MGSEEEVRTARRRDGSYRRLDIASIAGTEWWRGVAGSRGRSGGGAMGSRLIGMARFFASDGRNLPEAGRPRRPERSDDGK